MKNDHYVVYYLSDSTGITVKTLGQSVMAQFAQLVSYEEHTLNFLKEEADIKDALEKIRREAEKTNHKAIVFYTLARPEHAKMLAQYGNIAYFYDCLEVFLRPLESVLGVCAGHEQGITRRAGGVYQQQYNQRMEALNFSLDHDDGVSSRNLDKAAVILVGVSRSGKTPTSMYLAMHYAIYACNFPIIPEDMERMQLPKELLQHRDKIHGLTLQSSRLSQIRQKRRPNSKYAELANCEWEIRASSKIMGMLGVPVVDTTDLSIEEISAIILRNMNIEGTLS